jgi:hypothetical protein
MSEAKKQKTETELVVYEVNIDVPDELADDFAAWLAPHAADLVALDDCRFLSAEVFTREDLDDASAGNRLFTVVYKLKDREGLQRYLDVHAPRLRGDLPEKFHGKLAFTRRIMGRTSHVACAALATAQSALAAAAASKP